RSITFPSPGSIKCSQYLAEGCYRHMTPSPSGESAQRRAAWLLLWLSPLPRGVALDGAGRRSIPILPASPTCRRATQTCDQNLGLRNLTIGGKRRRAAL